MPKSTFAVLMVSVILAAGATVWLLSTVGAGALAVALPAALIAALLIRWLGR